MRVHVREQAEEFRRLAQRYGQLWTPTILELDPAGVEQHRIEGFLPAEDLLAQLMLGLAHAAFRRQEWREAAHRFDEIVERLPDDDAAAEAEYWAGVASYKETGDSAKLAETARYFADHFQGSQWAKRASVWSRPAA